MKYKYPPIEAYTHFLLEVAPTHKIYVEECGNPSGIPILFVQGGPGVGSFESDRSFFNPELYRIVLFDMRGAGRSQPFGQWEDNTTQDLISDIEKIRIKLNISKWVCFGGSWGSTLALAYAQSHPEKVSGLILRGIFLGTQECLDSAYTKSGAGRLFPEEWQKLEEFIPKDEHKDIIEAFWSRLCDKSNPSLAKEASKVWARFEGACSCLEKNEKLIEMICQPSIAGCFSPICIHYVRNKLFLKEDQLINAMSRLKNIPGIIIHGRYDALCPLSNAWKLQQHWPGSKLEIIESSGHSASEPRILEALMRATESMPNLI